MLTVELPAKFPRIAHPEMLRLVRIETFGARFAHTLGMLVEAQATLTFSPGSAYASARPLNRVWGRSSGSAPAACASYPPAVRRVSSPQLPTPPTSHFGTQCLSKAVAGLLAVTLFVCDVFKGRMSIQVHKRHNHQFLQ